MNKQMLTGIIIIAAGVIIMAIMTAVGTGYIQIGRTTLANKNTKKVTDNQDSINNKLDGVSSNQKSNAKSFDSLKNGQSKMQSQLESLSKDIMSKSEKDKLLLDFGQILKKEIGDSGLTKNDYSNPEYIETTDEHKKGRINVTIESGQTFFDNRGDHFDKKYSNHKLGVIGFDFQDFTVRNSKYDTNIRNKIISAVGNLFGSNLSGTWRYRSLGDTYVLYIPVLNEAELINSAKKLHVVLNSYDWHEFDAELFLNTITTYTIFEKNESIESSLRYIFKSLIAQKKEGTVFSKANDKSNSSEELYTLISYKKLKK